MSETTASAQKTDDLHRPLNDTESAWHRDVCQRAYDDVRARKGAGFIYRDTIRMLNTIDAQAVEIARLREELSTEQGFAQTLFVALRRLVRMKDRKDREGTSERYEQMKPIAWEAARAALEGRGLSANDLGDWKTEIELLRAQVAEIRMGERAVSTVSPPGPKASINLSIVGHGPSASEVMDLTDELRKEWAHLFLQECSPKWLQDFLSRPVCLTWLNPETLYEVKPQGVFWTVRGTPPQAELLFRVRHHGAVDVVVFQNQRPRVLADGYKSPVNKYRRLVWICRAMMARVGYVIHGDGEDGQAPPAHGR